MTKREAETGGRRGSLGGMWQGSRGKTMRLSQGSGSRQTRQTLKRHNQQMAIAPKTGFMDVSPIQRCGLESAMELPLSTTQRLEWCHGLNSVPPKRYVLKS